jgi:Uma2 family endonuclease
MSVQVIDKIETLPEQRFNLPGSYSWEQFKQIQETLHSSSRLKITYLDGCIEFMTLGEQHEKIKTILGFLIECYLVQKQVAFTPAGSATRESEIKGASFEPDESYYIGQQKEHPDLAIEINITSGSIRKLERYKRFQIREVWFWENEEIAIYHLREISNPEKIYYEKITASEILPELDIALLNRCLLMSSSLEAMTAFLEAMKKS